MHLNRVVRRNKTNHIQHPQRFLKTMIGKCKNTTIIEHQGRDQNKHKNALTEREAREILTILSCSFLFRHVFS